MSIPEVNKAFQEHGWHVIRRARSILGSEDEAKDVCQDVFVKLTESFRTIRDKSSLTAWLYRVTTNMCIDRIRVRKIQCPDKLEQLAFNGDTEKTALHRQILFRCIQGLSVEEQQLAILRYVDELTLEEMEEVCGLTRKTISKRLKRLQIRAKKTMARNLTRGE